MRDAAAYVTDTLDLAWAAAQSVFEKQTKPEHALKILELFLLEANKSKLDRVEIELGAQAVLGAQRTGDRFSFSFGAVFELSFSVRGD